MTSNLTREQWMLANSLAGVVNASNAPFCVGECEQREEINRDPHYIDNVATQLSQLCGRMALEDTVQLLETALAKLDDHPRRGSL
jgi:hypothetical protein